MKKILFVGVMIFAFALTMNVAFACQCMPYQQRCACPDQSNSAYNVSNQVTSASSTGLNSNAYVFGPAGINTGAATSATYGANAVNSNVKTGWSFGPSAQTNRAANVANVVSSGSYTGQNTNAYTGSASIRTGAAGSTTVGINLVNTNVKLSH